MNNIINGVWGITLLVLILGGLPYLIWIVYTAFKKRWKKLGLLFALALLKKSGDSASYRKTQSGREV